MYFCRLQSKILVILVSLHYHTVMYCRFVLLYNCHLDANVVFVCFSFCHSLACCAVLYILSGCRSSWNDTLCYWYTYRTGYVTMVTVCSSYRPSSLIRLKTCAIRLDRSREFVVVETGTPSNMSVN